MNVDTIGDDLFHADGFWFLMIDAIFLAVTLFFFVLSSQNTI